MQVTSHTVCLCGRLISPRAAASPRSLQAVEGVGTSFLFEAEEHCTGWMVLCISVPLLMDPWLLLAVVTHAVNMGVHRSVRFSFPWAQSRNGISGSRDGLLAWLRLSPAHPILVSACVQAMLSSWGFLLLPPQLCLREVLSAANAPPHQPATAPWVTSSWLSLIPSPS